MSGIVASPVDDFVAYPQLRVSAVSGSYSYPSWLRLRSMTDHVKNRKSAVQGEAHMPRIGNGPRDVEFNSVKQLMNRMHPQPGDNVMRVSADEADVPAWQRNVVWTAEEMGLLALSIIQNYPNRPGDSVEKFQWRASTHRWQAKNHSDRQLFPRSHSYPGSPRGPGELPQ